MSQLTPVIPSILVLFGTAKSIQFNALHIQLTGTAAKKFFSRMGVSIITYIVDILVLSKSFERYIRDAQFITDRLIELGLHIKEKCLL